MSSSSSKATYIPGYPPSSTSIRPSCSSSSKVKQEVGCLAMFCCYPANAGNVKFNFLLLTEKNMLLTCNFSAANRQFFYC